MNTFPDFPVYGSLPLWPFISLAAGLNLLVGGLDCCPGTSAPNAGPDQTSKSGGTSVSPTLSASSPAPPLTLAPSAQHTPSSGRQSGAPRGSVVSSGDWSGRRPHVRPHASVVRHFSPRPSPALGSVSCPPELASGPATPPTRPVPVPARLPKLQPSVPSQPVTGGSALGVCAVPRCRAQPCDEPLHRKGALWQPSFSVNWGTPEEDFLRVPAAA